MPQDNWESCGLLSWRPFWCIVELRGISDMQRENTYLPEFLEDLNKCFAVVPRSKYDAHRPLLPTENLDLILCYKETRTLTKKLTVHYNNVIYQIQTQRPTYAMRCG